MTRSLAALFFLGLCVSMAAAVARADETRRWRSVPAEVSNAYTAFRQSDDWLADAMAQSIDGDRVGRITPEGRPLDFDPARALDWAVADLNRDGRNEVFLLFGWSTGNQPSHGVVMQRFGNGWRIACNYRTEARPSGIFSAVPILDHSSRGWRWFQVHTGIYAWQPSPDGPGAVDCVRAGLRDDHLRTRAAAPWRRIPGYVSLALDAFRQTDHPLADSITRNLDGAQIGRATPEGPPRNFDPTRHLSWVVAGGDDRHEVFLLFRWPLLEGENRAPGVVMQQTGRDSWHLACAFRADAAAPVTLLGRRGRSDRGGFRVASGTYTWPPAPAGQGAADCATPAPG